jgi:hypothetical protein
MNSDVKSDMKWSSHLFLTQVWPMCKGPLGGGDLMRMEGRPDMELAKTLDMKAGIDGWQLHNDGMRGIASRVQAGKEWSSFTVRMRRDSGATTEYEKRLAAIQDGRGWLYPHVTIQAYAQTQEGPIVSVGIVLTKDLIGFIQNGYSYKKRTGNALFAVCMWDKIESAGYPMKIIRSKVEADRRTISWEDMQRDFGAPPPERWQMEGLGL